ncbi:uncharacterized protein LOC109820407 [Asparagus officinalis]|uniref:uncharacterized protein LOC109820407 n=1 Tax=Asparagus officinalis TaxID=4686 RepID=UPI00098DEAC9|nr:uncharacterized protein LOC109820407 [Asparagus officinalis]
MASNTVLAMASNGAKRIIRGLRSSALILKFLPNFVRHLSNKARRNCGNIGIAQVAAASWANSPSDEESLPSACKEHALQKELIGQGTEKLDLQGKVVVLGFIDSHVHLIAGGLQMGRAELRDVKRQEDFVQKVKEDVRDKTPGEWVLGHGWNNDIWGALPGASWIDGITHDNPVWLSRRDGHMGVANSLALKIAGITNITKDPVGGSILRTMDGEPTGLLADSAMKLVLDVIPEVSVSERRNALLKASKYALMKGVTTVVDVGRYIPGTPVDHPWQDLSDVYMWADSTGKMLIRVCLFFPIQSWSCLAEFREKKGSSLSQWIYLGGVKAFADGSLGSNNALFHEPDEDDPHNYGLRVTDFDGLIDFKEGRQGGFECGRYGKPTTQVLEKKMSALERAETTLFVSSGMYASCAVLSTLVPAGGHIVTTTDCYRKTRMFIENELPKKGIV